MKLFTYMTAAALAVGGVATVGCKDDGRSAQQQVGDAAKKTGDAVETGVKKTGDAAVDAKNAVVAAATPSGSNDVDDVKSAMEGILQNAFGENDFKTMTNHLVKPDKTRLEAQAPDKMPEHAQAVKTFQDAWKAKYGGDLFKVMDNKAVFNADFMTVAGEPRKQAMATIKASHGMPEVKLNFMDDAGKWRLDVPDSLDANKIRAGLVDAARDLTAKQAEWPADKNEASRLVAHRVFMVLTDAAGGSSSSGSPAAPARTGTPE